MTPDDHDGWLPLWRGYLDFYATELDEVTTTRTWERLVGGDPALVGLVAEDHGEPVGICHLVLHPSTWSETDVCYLEDLFVAREQRGSGIGRALIAAAAEEARAAGCHRLYWQTKADNTVARRLYDRVAEHRGFVVYELDLDD